MYVDRTKSAADNMLALINTSNGTTLTLKDVKLGDPVALAPVYLPKADASDPTEPRVVDRSADNTEFTVTGQGDYSDVVKLTYRRLDLDFEVQVLRYEARAYLNWTDFKLKFATANDIRVEELVFNPNNMPSMPGVNLVTVNPVAKSPLYFGTKTIRINV